MSDLPVITPSADPLIKDQNGNTSQVTMSITPGGKEGESISINNSEAPLKAVGHEVDLPKEVQAAGVQVHPMTVALPQTVSDQGVQSVGQNVSSVPTSGTSVKLPLKDSEIEQALKKNATHSIRWLAEWCVFQLKKVHEKVITNNNHSK